MPKLNLGPHADRVETLDSDEDARGDVANPVEVGFGISTSVSLSKAKPWYTLNMQVNINENAEAIVKRLLESGQFSTVDSAVNSIILTAFPKVGTSETNRVRLPDPILDSAEFEAAAELPHRPFQPLGTEAIAGRLPEFLEAQ